MATQTQTFTRPVSVQRATTSVIHTISHDTRLSLDVEDLSVGSEESDAPVEELPGYTPSSVPRYTTLAAERPTAVFTVRQIRRRERLITPVAHQDGDSVTGDSYVIQAKRTPSFWRSFRKSPDLELTRIKTEDATRTNSIYGGGSSSWRDSTASLNLSNLFNSSSQAGSPWTSREPPAYSRVSPTRTSSRPPMSRSAGSNSKQNNTTLLGHLYTTAPHPLRSPIISHTPKLQFTYLRNPLSPKLVTIHAPNFSSFRMYIIDAPKDPNQLDQPLLADQKYYTWKLTTYPTPAHSLLDKQGTCVARFVYSAQGCEARGWDEEIGKLEIYDASLPKLTVERAGESRGRIRAETTRSDTTSLENVQSSVSSANSTSGSENEGSTQKDDWTEVIIASSDLVVQYWRSLGRRYTNRPYVRTSGIPAGTPNPLATRCIPDPPRRRELARQPGMMALNRAQSLAPNEMLGHIHSHTVGAPAAQSPAASTVVEPTASNTTTSPESNTANTPRGRNSLSLSRTLSNAQSHFRSLSQNTSQSISQTRPQSQAGEGSGAPTRQVSARAMSLIETRRMIVCGYGGAPPGYARQRVVAAAPTRS